MSFRLSTSEDLQCKHCGHVKERLDLYCYFAWNDGVSFPFLYPSLLGEAYTNREGYNSNYEKNYLAGKYGAIPDLNSTIEYSLKEE